MKNSFIINLIFCSLIAFSCKDKKPTEPEQNNEARTDSTLIVDKYELPAGETETFPATYKIISEKDIDIKGNLVIAGDKRGDFVIRSRNGNIRISGSVLVQKDTSQLMEQKRFVSKNTQPRKISATQGTNLSFILDRPGGMIVFDSDAQVRSGDGTSALDENVGFGVEHYVGNVGVPGGDIIIRALGGLIRFEDIEHATKSLFILGNGGDGANIVVDRNTFQTSSTKLDITGGRGGDSGILILEAEKIEGIPTVDQLPDNIEIISQGIGGNGGAVLWFNANRPVFGNTADIKTTYPLQEINFRGGDGGNGATEGGKGGFAAYWGLRTINERGNTIASVKVTGGNGGDVFASPIPIYLALGGDGGEYFAWGNSGWSGVPADSGGPIDGADAGDVSGYGGDGGDVREDVMFYSAVGGSGGNSEIAQKQIIQKLSYFGYRYPNNFENQGPLFVVSGFGGRGADSGCNGCPGGNGGSSGNVLAVGGHGGNVPNRSGARGGRGGDVWDVISWFASYAGIGENQKGGNGNPPGKGGCSQAVATSPGSGGNGFLPGEDGKFLNVSTVGDDEHCDENGTQCGEGLECKDNDSTRTSCRQVGATAQYYYKSTFPEVVARNFVTGEVKLGEDVYTYNLTATVIERNETGSFIRIQYDWSEVYTFRGSQEIQGNWFVNPDTTTRVDSSTIRTEFYVSFPGFHPHGYGCAAMKTVTYNGLARVCITENTRYQRDCQIVQQSGK